MCACGSEFETTEHFMSLFSRETKTLSKPRKSWRKLFERKC